MAITKWRDAYTYTKTNLKHVKADLGKTAICRTHGKIVYRGKKYIVIEQHTATVVGGNDYFVIPKSLVFKRK